MRTRRSQSSSDPVLSSLERAQESGHRTVLLHEAIQELDIQKGDIVVDATLGGAGHARALAKMLSSGGIFIGFDLDEEAITRSQHALSNEAPETHLIRANFRNISKELEHIGISRIDKALFDLGWSGYQLTAGRGFSFLKDEPLLMTYASDPKDSLTAGEIVNTWGEESISDILFGWGQERFSRRIAKMIVERRVKQPFKTSHELGEAIKSCVPGMYRNGRIHPATKSFQALRIAVNDELGALKEGLQGAWENLGPNGHIAVISFHSIEDKIVKEMFLEYERSGEGKRITRSPIKPTPEELRENPRARSAKLRVIQKNKP